MSSSTWQEHFQSRLAGLEPPREGSFLETALTEGRLTEDEYLEWATKALHLPVLAGNFFAEQTPNSELMSRVALPWTSTLFPISEWDGVLVVACLEVPAGLPPSVVCVLAAPSNMMSWWERLAEYAGSVSANEAMEGLDLNAANAAPAGLSFAGLTLSARGETPAEAAPPIEQTPAASPAPAPAVAAVKVTPAAKTAPPIKLEAPVAEPVTASSVVAEESISRAPATVTPVTAGAAPADVHVNPSTEPHILSPLVSGHKTFLKEVAGALGEMLTIFPKAMFMSTNETGKAVVPLVWTKSFGQPNVVSRIPLTTPSPFRVAMATEKPYHGHLVPSDINELFSKVWNEGKSPEHLTVVPFFFRGRAVGALVAVGTASHGSLAILRAAEKIGASLTEKLGGKAEDLAA